MDTKDLINIKKQRIKEELQKVIPPGFHLFPPPKKRTEVYDKLDQFLGIDADFSMQVGYLSATDKGYDQAIQHLRSFGIKLKDYKDAINSGPFYKDSKLNKNLEEACDYIIRFYNLAKIIIKRSDEELELNLKALQRERDKLSKESSQEEKKQKAANFVSGSTKSVAGETLSIKSTKIPNVSPKAKAIPKELAEKISKQIEPKESEEPITAPKRIVSVLGRLTLDLESISNNIDKTREAILEDYKNTREINKKEVEEYKKRVANRGRKIGRRELGNDKTSLKDIIKKYVGSFFSGAGGAIRALSLFNMIEAFANGKPLNALGPLLGFSASYLPQIGQVIGGVIAGKVLGGLFKGGRTATRAARSATRTAGTAMEASKLGKFSKFGGKAALLAGGLALGSQLFGMPEKDDTQQRLEDLTEEQKSLVSPESLVPVPQDELKKFEELNKRFEKAIDFLLGKQKEQERTVPTSSDSGSPSTPSPTSEDLPTADTLEAAALLKTIQQAEGADYFTLFGGKKLSQLTQMTLDEVIQMGNTGKLPSRFGGGDAGYKPGSRATGAYQYMPGTLEGLKSRLGLTGTETFDPAFQDRLALSSVVSRGVDPNAPLTNEAIKKLSGQWAPLPGNTYMFQGKRQTRFTFDQIKSMYQRNLGSAPEAPILPSQNQLTQSPAQYPNITIVPSSQTPTIVPFSIPTGQESTPMSMSDQGNKIIDNISTTYPENFLTLYSKLIYQIV